MTVTSHFRLWWHGLVFRIAVFFSWIFSLFFSLWELQASPEHTYALSQKREEKRRRAEQCRAGRSQSSHLHSTTGYWHARITNRQHYAFLSLTPSLNSFIPRRRQPSGGGRKGDNNTTAAVAVAIAAARVEGGKWRSNTQWRGCTSEWMNEWMNACVTAERRSMAHTRDKNKGLRDVCGGYCHRCKHNFFGK
jgi:hypothetical protein